MRVKFDCPISFICVTSLTRTMVQNNMYMALDDPECVIVNPGTKQFLSNDYFDKFP